MRFPRHSLLLILPVLWSLSLFDLGIFTGGDNAYYLMLAKSIATDFSYQDILTPGHPPHTKFAPLLPAMMAPLVLAFGHTYIPEKLLIFLFYCISLVLVYHFMKRFSGFETRKRFGLAIVVVLTLAFGFNYHAIEHSHYVLSEIPYLALSLASLLLFDRHLQSSQTKYLLWAILLAVLAYHTRTVGITLLGAELLILLFRNRRSFLIGSAFALALALPWTIRSIMYSGQGEENYIAQFLMKSVYAPELGQVGWADVFKRFSGNTSLFVLKVYGELLNSKVIFSPVSVALFFTTLIGMLLALFNRRTAVLVLYLVFYNVFLLSWHWYDTRYALPVLPLFLFLLWLGLEKLASLARIWLPALITLFVLMIGVNLHTELSYFPARWQANQAWLEGDKLAPYPPQFKSYFAAALYAEQNTPPEAVFCARKPSLFWWFAQRQVVIYPLSTDREKVREFLKKNNIRHVVFDTFYRTTGEYLLPALEEIQDKVKIVYQTETDPKVYILELAL